MATCPGAAGSAWVVFEHSSSTVLGQGLWATGGAGLRRGLARPALFANMRETNFERKSATSAGIH